MSLRLFTEIDKSLVRDLFTDISFQINWFLLLPFVFQNPPHQNCIQNLLSKLKYFDLNAYNRFDSGLEGHLIHIVFPFYNIRNLFLGLKISINFWWSSRQLVKLETNILETWLNYLINTKLSWIIITRREEKLIAPAGSVSSPGLFVTLRTRPEH